MSRGPGHLPRAAMPADAPALARLRLAFRGEVARPTESEIAFLARCTRWMQARLSASSRWRCWVVDGQTPGELTGTIWLQTIEKIPNPNPTAEPELHGYITNLYVQPGQRGRGLGEALLATALRACDADRCDAVLLWPSPESRSLYRRHGFTVADDLLQRRRAP
jgi:ribosomal protein S18 acetylase RimI-like enzyme